jgi:hypothetical protein
MDITNNEKKNCITMGDFSADLLKYNTHNKTNDYIDNMFAKGFLPLILTPTRITQPTATLHDHIYSNDIKSNSTPGIKINDVDSS